jgi:hypothetical protein
MIPRRYSGFSEVAALKKLDGLEKASEARGVRLESRGVRKKAGETFIAHFSSLRSEFFDNLQSRFSARAARRGRVARGRTVTE